MFVCCHNNLRHMALLCQWSSWSHLHPVEMLEHHAMWTWVMFAVNWFALHSASGENLSTDVEETWFWKKKFPLYCTFLHRCFCWFPGGRGCWGFCSTRPGHHPLHEERQTSDVCSSFTFRRSFFERKVEIPLQWNETKSISKIRNLSTHIWGLLQTCSVRCARTERRGQAAGRRWCSWWSEWPLSVALCCGWTGRASGSPGSSPDPPLRCRSMTVGTPSLTPDQSSSLSWYMGRVRLFRPYL